MENLPSFSELYRRSGTPRNGGSETIEYRTIVGPFVKNAERPLEKQLIYIPHTLLSTAINRRGLAAFPV